MAENPPDDERGPLAAFNNQLTFEEAWGYKKQCDVTKFIDKVVAKPADYGVVEEWQPHIKDISDGITLLKLDGKGYSKPRPQQYIRRNAVNNRPEEPLELNPYVFPGGHRVSSLYDLVAIFLSLARAPLGAQRDNFYLPWTILYLRWMHLFLPKKKGTASKGGKYPTMFQCTWRTEESIQEKEGKKIRKKEQSRFFIGVVLSGYAKTGTFPKDDKRSQTDNNPWVNTVRRARFALLSNNGRGDGTVDGDSYGDSPCFRIKAIGGEAGWNWGNCAETHPFVELVKDKSDEQKDRCFGFAVRPDQADPVSEQGTYTTIDWEGLALPCDNCDVMIVNLYHCQYLHFIPLPPPVDLSYLKG